MPAHATPDRAARQLAARYDEHVGFLVVKFPTLTRDDCVELVQNAFAQETIWDHCPRDRPEEELMRWFRTVLSHDAVDFLRRRDGRERPTADGRLSRRRRLRHVSIEASARETAGKPLPGEDASDSGGLLFALTASYALAAEDPALEAVERQDHENYTARTVATALAQADPDTAQLLRARLDAELPTAIALRYGWSRRQYERRIGAAHKQLLTLIARIEEGPHCTQVRTLLRERAGTLLTDDSRRALALHLETCLACRAYERTVLQRIRQRVAALLPLPLPFSERLIRRGGGGGAAGASTSAAHGALAGTGAKILAVAGASMIVGGGYLVAQPALHKARHHDQPAAPTAPAFRSSAPAAATPAPVPARPPRPRRRGPTPKRHRLAATPVSPPALAVPAASRPPVRAGGSSPSTFFHDEFTPGG